MAQNGGFEFEFQGDHRRSRPTPLPPPPTTNNNITTTFSQLLFGAHDHQHHDSLALDLRHTNFNHHHKDKLPKMLCFGGGDDNTDEAADDDQFLFGIGNAGMAASTPPPPQRSVVTCTDSCSSPSSVNNKTAHNNSSTNKKRGGNLEVATAAAAGSQGGSKKSKPEKGAAKGRVKVRKERLGERIAALQQLVSPFGKTDTASVLHEAMGYIRFLQEQVEVLCSPYLQPLLPAAAKESGENGAQGEEKRRDLRSRGLCLVPLACTVHVASTNGADFWSPAMANNARI